MNKPEDFLIKNNVLKSDYTEDQQFPLNLTRDTNIKTARDIVLSMVEYSDHKIKEYKKSIIKDGGLIVE